MKKINAQGKRARATLALLQAALGLPALAARLRRAIRIICEIARVVALALIALILTLLISLLVIHSHCVASEILTLVLIFIFCHIYVGLMRLEAGNLRPLAV